MLVVCTNTFIRWEGWLSTHHICYECICPSSHIERDSGIDQCSTEPVGRHHHVLEQGVLQTCLPQPHNRTGGLAEDDQPDVALPSPGNLGRHLFWLGLDFTPALTAPRPHGSVFQGSLDRSSQWDTSDAC